MKYTIVLLLVSYSLFGQTTISKRALTGYWRSDINVDSIKKDDTVFFTKAKKIEENLYFKSNHQLKEHIFFGRCGNKFFLDYFTLRQSEYATIALWNLDTKDKKTHLSLSIGKLDQEGKDLIWQKDLRFLLVSRAKNQFSLKLIDINIPRVLFDKR